MGRRRKSKTVTGRRIPIEMDLIAKSISLKKKISLQDAYRELARRLQR